MQCQAIKDKTRNTNMERYNTPCTLQEPNTAKKRKNTMEERYGSEHALQNDDLLNQALNKRAKSLEGTDMFSSNYQNYLCEILNGRKNVACERYLIDIVVDNFAIEYDGGGHNLDLKFGIITQEEYRQQQFVRNQVLLNNGYKIINIKNLQDINVDDNDMLNMIHSAMSQNQDFVIINISDTYK